MRIVAFSLLLALLQPVAAQTPDCIGTKLNATDIAALPRLAQQSEAIVAKFCAAELSSKRQVAATLVEFLHESAAEFEALGIGASILPLRPRVADIRQAVDAGHDPDNMLPSPGTPVLRFSSGAVAVAKPQDCDASVARARQDGRTKATTCQELLDSYQRIYSHAQFLVQKDAGEKVAKYLNLAQKDWDDFFVKSRSQTTWELVINSALWRKDKKAGMFLEPPERQLIVLHPSVVIEYVSDAVDGSKQKEGILLEWVGANWWRREKWYQLSGGSLVSVYSDRAGMSSWRHGVALHFGNKLTVGAVGDGGERGVYVSIDVLELFKEKRTLIDSYIGKVEAAVQ